MADSESRIRYMGPEVIPLTPPRLSDLFSPILQADKDIVVSVDQKFKTQSRILTQSTRLTPEGIKQELAALSSACAADIHKEWSIRRVVPERELARAIEAVPSAPPIFNNDPQLIADHLRAVEVRTVVRGLGDPIKIHSQIEAWAGAAATDDDALFCFRACWWDRSGFLLGNAKSAVRARLLEVYLADRYQVEVEWRDGVIACCQLLQSNIQTALRTVSAPVLTEAEKMPLLSAVA